MTIIPKYLNLLCISLNGTEGFRGPVDGLIERYSLLNKLSLYPDNLTKVCRKESVCGPEDIRFEI